jgi:hypothetical protein
MPRKSDEAYSEKDTVERRDAALGRALSAPPKPRTKEGSTRSHTGINFYIDMAVKSLTEAIAAKQ